MSAELHALPVAAGEADLSWLHERYYTRLVRFATRRFGPGDAEDIAQEALARCVANRDRIDLARDPWPWLVTVAQNVGLDLVRSRRRSVPVEDDALERNAPVVRDTADVVVASEERRLVVAALDKLRPSDRRILRLREVEGLSFEAIGEFLGTTPNAARQQMFRARGRLARAYQRLGGGVGALLAYPVARLRRFAYRHADGVQRLAAAIGPGGWAVVAAPVGGLAGAVVLGAGGVDATAASGPRVVAVAYASVRDAETSWPAGLPGTGGGAGAGRAGAGAGARPGERYDVRVSAGPASARSRVRDPRRFSDPGKTDETRVSVETPFGTLTVGTMGENSPGQGVVCHVPGVRCSRGQKP